MVGVQEGMVGCRWVGRKERRQRILISIKMEEEGVDSFFETLYEPDGYHDQQGQRVLYNSSSSSFP